MASTEVATLQAKIKAELAAMRGSVAAPAGRNISLKGKVFTLPNGQSSQGPMKAVILDHRNFNRYYTAAYNPTDPKPPQCFAINKTLADLAPHEDAAEPQAEACNVCPMNVWGSAATGKGKACRNTTRIAIAPADTDGNDDPMILTISPTGLKSWNALVNSLESAGMIPAQVVVEIAFDDNAAYPTLVFKALGAHDDLEKFWGLRDRAQTMLDQPPAAN